MNKYLLLENLHDAYNTHQGKRICTCGRLLESSITLWELFFEIDDLIYEINPWLIKAAFGYWAMNRQYKTIDNFIAQTKLFNKEMLNNLKSQAEFEEFFNSEQRLIFYTTVKGNIYAAALSISLNFIIPLDYKKYETGAAAIIKYSKKEEI